MKNKLIRSRKLKHGSVSLALTIFIVVSAIILNVAATMLSNKYHWMYLDMTSEQLFTLSDDCVDLLDRSFVKILENRKGMNKELPKTNHGIAEENVKTAEMNVVIAQNAINAAEKNLLVAKENLVVFEQNIVKARTNVNIAVSNLELAELLAKEAAKEAGRAEGEEVNAADRTNAEKLAAVNLEIAKRNLEKAKENLLTVANNAKTAEENAENKKFNEKNALKEGDEGFRPYKSYTSLKAYEAFASTAQIKEKYDVSFIDHAIYDNYKTAEENLNIANQNLEIAKENLEIAKEILTARVGSVSVVECCDLIGLGIDRGLCRNDLRKINDNCNPACGKT